MELARSFFISNLYDKKVMQSGLWLVWICGFCLIGVSFYCTLMLPIILEERAVTVKTDLSGFGGDIKITLFTSPKPFAGEAGDRQALVVRSWLGLSENINVVLFSQHPSVVDFANSIGPKVSVERNIDFTFLGTPFFHSMVARSLTSSSDITVLIDPNTILLPNFLSTLEHALKLDEDWILFAFSQNISHFPFHLTSDGKSWVADDGKHVRIKKLQEFLDQENGYFAQREDRMIIAWSSITDLPLHKGVLPPFLYGKGVHNHWILNEALTSDYRLVIDASSTLSSFYLDPTSHLSIRKYTKSESETGTWEMICNSFLGNLYGSFSFRKENFSNLYRFFRCNGNYLIINTDQNIVYQLGHRRLLSLRKKEVQGCVDAVQSIKGIEQTFVQKKYSRFPASSLSLPFSLQSLLPLVADQNKTIVLGVAGFSYKDMLMSWACRLRHLNISNFLVCALDDEIRNFSVLQGLPVFKFPHAPTNISFDDCHFGTECFQRVTKVKSRLVLRILKLGYNVLMSDVDVYWFKNPLPYLTSFGPNVLVAQSDEYNITEPINLPRRLNSGFYYAHSDNATITGLEKVVKHASASNLSEQPSFYDTLCGENGSYRLGNYQCFEPETRLKVHFLHRDLFPNGAYRDLWLQNDTKKTCERMGCFVLHNNWISGRKKKLERQVMSGLWEYDISTRMCIQEWRKKTAVASYF